MTNTTEQTKTKLNKLSRDILKELNGNEIISDKYESCVFIEGDKVISEGIIIDTLNTNIKIRDLFKEFIYNEYGTNNFDSILKLEVTP